MVGNAYGAAMVDRMGEAIDIKGCVSCGNFKPINEWANDKIWKYGGIYTSGELMRKFIHAESDSAGYIEYLKNKYKEIYKL